ncbi:hypothetical protein WICPIJ_008016 [Wickerhamomyces pijperi]|uniref:SCP domain-containing protein n=1 Tax=Wickerhamomyces pijperi TaxID=599730 RepID=A0A9P8PZ37_WICPI|nr:hypothetical protein WICPIJ_008016 [Wickerhamomyces pijperi]
MKLFIFLLNFALAVDVVTVYNTKLHTVVNYETQVATNTITIWSTAGLVNENNSNHAVLTKAATTTLTQQPTSATVNTDQTSTQTSTVRTTVTLDSFATDIINTHNNKRALHQDTPSLFYSTEIAAVSQQYADQYTCNGNLTHHHNVLYGENLALGYNTTAAVTAWYDEISQYDYNNPGFSENTGHFTQLVWSNSTLVGCGFRDCGAYYGQYTVCQYYTPGNYAGLYGTYVKPLKS